MLKQLKVNKKIEVTVTIDTDVLPKQLFVLDDGDIRALDFTGEIEYYGYDTLHAKYYSKRYAIKGSLEFTVKDGIVEFDNDGTPEAIIGRLNNCKENYRDRIKEQEDLIDDADRLIKEAKRIIKEGK